jgi:hypothetical protein
MLLILYLLRQHAESDYLQYTSIDETIGNS